MDQSTFNNLIFLHANRYYLEQVVEKDEEIMKLYNISHQAVYERQQSGPLLDDKIHIPETLLSSYGAMQSLSEESKDESATPLRTSLEELQKARFELQTYLNRLSNIQHVKPSIDAQVKNAEAFATEHFANIDQRVNGFINHFSKNIQNEFGCGFKYQKPLSNSLFIKIMTHPSARVFAAVLLIAGLVSVGVGVCLTGAATAITTGLIVGGIGAATLSSGVFTAGLFKHPSPVDADAGKSISFAPAAAATSP